MPSNSVHPNKLFEIRKRIKCNLLHMLRHLIDCHVHEAISFVFFSLFFFILILCSLDSRLTHAISGLLAFWYLT